MLDSIKHRIGRGAKLALLAMLSLPLFLLPVAGWAQTETGQIIGRVTDPQGALVPNAAVTVKSVETSATRTATTNDQGQYVVANLQPGFYDVTVRAQGFAQKTQRAQVTVGSQVSLETGLTIQATGEVVEVVASGGVEVNTQNQELSSVISGNQIRELPTITRNPYDLVGLSSNVSPVDPSFRGAGFSINGQRAASTNILLDGADNNDVFTASVGQSVPLDSVQEFRVITSNFTAEYGRASGGIVNVATRSGSNDWHGSLYEFYRGSALTSNSLDNNARGISKGNFVRNQFGYSVGGRIITDKLFFFSSTEWIRARSNSEQIAFVPTPELLAASATATQNFFNAVPLATPINGSVLNVGDVIASLGPSTFPPGNAFAALPAGLPAFGQVRYNVATDIGGGLPQNSVQTVGRVDWNISEKAQLYGRYALEDQDFFDGTNAFSPYRGFNTGINTRNNNFLLSFTYTFSPNLVSQSKFVYNRLNNFQPLGEQPPGPTLYIFGNVGARLDNELVAFPGYLPFNPGVAIPFGGPQNLIQAYQDVNYHWGNHQLRFGGSYIYIQDNRTFGAYQNAVETLGTSFAQSLGNLVAGQLLRFEAAVDPQGRFPGETITLPVAPPNFSRSNRFNEYSLYAQDGWRILPRLTVNLGLRYEYFGVPHNSNQRLDSNFYFGPGADIFEQIRNGRVFIAEDSPVGKLWESDTNNFAPRLGVAWDVTGDGKTSLRGGYGISYERNFNNVTFNVIQNPPNYAVIRITPVNTGAPIPITTSNVGPLSGSGITVTLPPTSLRHVREDIETAHAHFWSLAIERQVTKNTVASARYSGSAGRDLYTISNINRVGSGAVYLGDARPTATLNTQYTGINTRGNGGRSNYNALILEINNSGLRNTGLQFTAAYTYAKSLDNLSTTFSESSNNFNLGLLDAFNPDLDYGLSDFDIRHRFSASFTYTVPYFRDASGFVKYALSGWEATGIFSARSGSPFTVFDCTNAAFEVCPRVQLNGPVDREGAGDNFPDPLTPNRYVYVDLIGLTPGTFVNPITGTSEFGPFPSDMSTRGFFQGPGAWFFDLGVYKRFNFSESKYLQFRAEFFNLFNHSNLYFIGAEADISQSSFVPARRGVFVGPNGDTQERRSIQLALKFVF